MDNTMIFIILFGGIAIVLFLLASLLARPLVIHRIEPLSKMNKYMYIISIAFMIIAMIIFLLSSYTTDDLSDVIEQF